MELFDLFGIKKLKSFQQWLVDNPDVEISLTKPIPRSTMKRMCMIDITKVLRKHFKVVPYKTVTLSNRSVDSSK